MLQWELKDDDDDDDVDDDDIPISYFAGILVVLVWFLPRWV
jgi:hypothetical protein